METTVVMASKAEELGKTFRPFTSIGRGLGLSPARAELVWPVKAISRRKRRV